MASHESAEGRLDRRSFLAALGGATGLALAGPLAGHRLPGGLAEGSPGRHGAMLEPIGLQLYTLRSLMEQDVPGTLQRVADVGFTEVEFAGYFDHEPAELRAMLDRLGLSAPSVHASLDALEGDAFQQTVDAARVLGHQWLVVPSIGRDQRTAEGFRRAAARLEAAAKRARDAGLGLGYHNHDFEFEPVDGTLPYEILCDTDPELVRLQLDLYWVRVAGQDAATWFERYPGRFPSVHVKDMAPDGVMTNVGGGVMEWPDLLGQARAAGVTHFFVENDRPGDDPIADVRSSYQFLHRLTV
jgi:sugar phosphate isomerase/epimerase